MKPIFKILIIILVVLVAGLTIYLLFSGGGEEATDAPAATAGEKPATGTETTLIVKKISDYPVFDFWLNESTKEIFYLIPDGKVAGVKEGSDLEISKQTIDALNLVEIGPGGRKVLAAFGDPQIPQWGIFDVVDGVWRPLPSEITNAAWGASDEKLIVLVESGDNLNLSEADLTKTPPSYRTFVRDLRLKDVKMTYLPENRLILSEKASAFYAASLWQLELKSLNFSVLIAPKEGLDVSWSDDKKSVFILSGESGLSVLDENFRTKIPSSYLPTTLPSKCAADTSKIYCFVPQNIPSDVSLPDDYLTRKFFSVDDLVIMEISSDEITENIKSNTAAVPAIDAKNPRVSGDKIYFINRYDGYLYEMAF